jgi:preprotein translocase subunit SecB
MSQNQNQQEAPHVSIVSQYVKDFSFENPHAPNSLVKLTKTPSVDLGLDLNVSKVGDSHDTYEVVLNIDASAKNEDMTLFVVELSYAGIFVLQNIPQDQHEPVLAIHCPNMIFPFARRIISDITQESGFQPLRIDPIDFARMYHKKLQERDSQEPEAHS